MTSDGQVWFVIFDTLTYFSELTPYQVLGVLGSVLYLTNYSCLQLGIVDGNGHCYRFGSMIAAGLVLTSLTEQFNLASAIIQISWICLSFIGFARAIWIMRRARKNRRDLWLAQTRLDQVAFTPARPLS